jgi:hypothetical protein
MPPNKNMDDWWTILRSGMWRLLYKLSAEGKTRFYSEFLPLLHDTKHEAMGERDANSYYLVYLGTRPGARGKGYAGKLIGHMTARVCFTFHPFPSSLYLFDGDFGFVILQREFFWEGGFLFSTTWESEGEERC